MSTAQPIAASRKNSASAQQSSGSSSSKTALIEMQQASSSRDSGHGSLGPDAAPFNGQDDDNDTPDNAESENGSADTGQASQKGKMESQERRKLSVYERMSLEMTSDDRTLKEVTLGKRVGFYRIRGDLGVGNFSQVKLATHVLSRERVAIKILDKTKLDAKTQRLLSREISSMERLRHPNVIRLYEVIETMAKLHIVMEYAPGGDLFTKITNDGKIPERDARSLFAQVCSAVSHLHIQHVIHRDLKAENVFFANPQTVKIGDFGFSTFAKPDQTLFTFCGSPPYAAPELFKDDSYYGPLVDLWALGVLLFFMVTGIMPFRADTVGKLKRLILAGEYSIPAFASDSCQFLIRGILRQNPADRFSMEQVQRSDWLEGQFFPRELQMFEMNPRPSNAIKNPRSDEGEALKLLSELGINDDHIKTAQGRASRSNITGTYRIMLHKVHRKKTGELEGELRPQGSALTVRSAATPDCTGRDASDNNGEGKRVSKLCSLL